MTTYPNFTFVVLDEIAYGGRGEVDVPALASVAAYQQLVHREILRHAQELLNGRPKGIVLFDEYERVFLVTMETLLLVWWRTEAK